MFELPLTSCDFKRSNFNWLSNKNSWLFIFEDGKRIRTFNIEAEPAKELQSASLIDTKSCTSLSWNFDSNLLALVIDKRQIYLWSTESNQFTYFKPSTTSSSHSLGKRSKPGDIEAIAWSQKTNKLAIGYSSGELILCNLSTSNITEKIVDNSDGVLNRVSRLESSSSLDLFVCVTAISEVLVMSFDGEVKFYIQVTDSDVIEAKFSDPIKEHVSIRGRAHQTTGFSQVEESVWLACRTRDGRLLLKKVMITKINQDRIDARSSSLDIIYTNDRSIDDQDFMMSFHWLDSNHLLACLSSGRIILLRIRNKSLSTQESVSYYISSLVILDIRAQEHGLNYEDPSGPELEFKLFELMSFKGHERIDQSTAGSFSMVALTDYRLFYYELFKLTNSDPLYAFEKVDDLDLTNSLKRKSLHLERVRWSLDCSMLAVQLTNAHILVYRTRLQSHLVTSHGSKTAYLSDTNEVTILDYGSTRLAHLDEISKPSNIEDEFLIENSSNNKALTVVLDSKPSVIGVGPRHLAVALNNRVWFYQISSNKRGHLSNEAIRNDDKEYASVVVELQLNSRFAAVLFNSGRLKLHAIQFKLAADESSSLERKDNNITYDSQKVDNLPDEGEEDDSNSLDDERFFPDPSRPDQITTFILTEELFIYCTLECCLNVFSLKDWTLVQTCGHSEFFGHNCPIEKLRGNERGNKFVCLVKESQTIEHNVCLYDLYSNKMIRFFTGSLYAGLFENQLTVQLLEHNQVKVDSKCLPQLRQPKLNRITEAVWDSDGRTIHLIAGKFIHSAVVLNHTLENEVEGTIIEYVATVDKPLSYKALYASNGIMSFQTSLGRVINSILETYDDELNLTNLNTEINSVLAQRENAAERDSVALHLDVMRLKLNYFRTTLSIYSLSKCKEIAEHLMNNEQNAGREVSFEEGGELATVIIDQVIWRQLAARALYTMNLSFALMIYRRYGLLFYARVLDDILADTRNISLDGRRAIRARLLALLDCDLTNNQKSDEV